MKPRGLGERHFSLFFLPWSSSFSLSSSSPSLIPASAASSSKNFRALDLFLLDERVFAESSRFETDFLLLEEGDFPFPAISFPFTAIVTSCGRLRERGRGRRRGFRETRKGNGDLSRFGQCTTISRGNGKIRAVHVGSTRSSGALTKSQLSLIPNPLSLVLFVFFFPYIGLVVRS